VGGWGGGAALPSTAAQPAGARDPRQPTSPPADPHIHKPIHAATRPARLPAGRHQSFNFTAQSPVLQGLISLPKAQKPLRKPPASFCAAKKQASLADLAQKGGSGGGGDSCRGGGVGVGGGNADGAFTTVGAGGGARTAQGAGAACRAAGPPCLQSNRPMPAAHLLPLLTIPPPHPTPPHPTPPHAASCR
jgi:hypothetical protein